MIYGSTHAGAALDATPDGKEGWLPYFLRNNLATVVMKQPGRGRSGFDQSILVETQGTQDWCKISSNFSRIADNGAWTTWFGHLIPAGSNITNDTMIRHSDPGDPDLPEDTIQPSEKHGKYLPKFPIPPVANSADAAALARKGAIGPAPNPANNPYLGLEYYKQQVPNGEATLPGSVCQSCSNPNLIAIDTWLPAAIADFVEGLGGAIVSPHSQSTSSVFHMVRIMTKRGKLHLIKGIIIPEGAGMNLAVAGLVGADFDSIPFLMLNSDYRPLATRQMNHSSVDEMHASPIRKAGKALSLNVEDPMFKGKLLDYTHMGMLGATSLPEFDFFLKWAAANIPNPMLRKSCEWKKGLQSS